MKLLSFAVCVFLYVLSLSVNAYSEVERDEMVMVIEQQVKSQNEQHVWQLYSPENSIGIEMFYDAQNISTPYEGAKIATTKTKYNDSSFLDKLQKSRKLQHELMGSDSQKLNYSDIAYTVQSFQIDCNRKEILQMEIIADFDKQHNLLNLLPSVRRQFSPIKNNSSYDKLYSILCNNK